MATSAVIAAILIALTPIPWWAVGIVRWVLKLDPSVWALREQAQRFTIAGTAGLFIAALCASYLANLVGLPHLPPNAGFVLLLGAIASIYAQPAWFIFRHKEYAVKFLSQLFQTEPVIVIGTATAAVDACLLVGVSFGAPVSADQKAAIDAAVTAVLGFAAMLFVRSQVTPVAAVAAPLPQPTK